jgi:hypothetical protein
MSAFWFAAIFLVQSQVTGQVQPGAVTGRLLSTNGAPAAGVRIAAVPVPDGGNNAGAAVLVGISQTDADGRYRLEGIPPGRYYIFAGLIDLPSYYPNATTLERASAILVEEGATLSGIDFTMARPIGLTVAGRLAIPSTMQFRGGSTVTLTPLNRGGATNSPQTAVVQGDGLFEFLRISPGEYRIASNLAGSGSAIVGVSDADVLNVILPVVDCNSGVLVRGKLVGVPTTPVGSIALTGSSAGCLLSTAVEADGSFAFMAVPEGVYQYRLTPNPLGWSAAGLTVRTTDLNGVEVALPSLVTVRGQAVVENGSALPKTSRGTPIGLVARQAGGEVSASIQDDGAFELKLPKGRYSLAVPGIPSGYYLKSMWTGLTDLTVSTFDVTEAAEEIDLTLGLMRPAKPSGVRVAGQVNFAPTGALPKSEGVLLVSAEKKNDPIYESALAADGSFEFFGVPPGAYKLETYPDSPAALHGIVVGKTDVTGIEFTLPVLVNVQGGIEWANMQGGGVSPSRGVSVQFTRKEGTRVLAWGALAQSGAFHFYLPEGDYRFSVSDLPPNFDLGSVTVGDVNILEDGLRVRADAEAPSLRVILRGK